MTNSSRVVSVSTSTDGLPDYQQNDAAVSPLGACGERWAKQQESMRDLPWSRCPPEMVADFARSMARELLGNDGDQAAKRACLFTACLMAEKNIERLDLAVRCPALNTSFNMIATIAPTHPQNNDQAAFQLEVGKQVDEQGVRDALSAFASQPGQAQFFDPIKQTPDAQVAQLVARAERIVGNSSFDPLVIAATALLTWNHMEKTNSAKLELALAGVSEGNVDLLPDGMGVVFKANTAGLAFSSDQAPSTERTSAATVRLPRR